MMGPTRTGLGAVPRHVVLCWLDVDVLEAVRSKTEFGDHRSGAKRQMVAVADVDGGSPERLARRRAAHLRTGLEQ